MSAASFAHAIQSLGFFTVIRKSGMIYPFVMTGHLASIALFGGLILITDLRLLGLALTGVPAGDVVKQLRPWKHLGFVIMISCGIMLFGAKADTYYGNPYFLTKMFLLLMVGVHALIFRPLVYSRAAELDRLPTMPGTAKLAAVLSLCLWIGILSMGRWIAYFEPPKPLLVQPTSTTQVISDQDKGTRTIAN